MIVKPLKVREPVYSQVTEYQDKEYTYDDIFEIWNEDNDTVLVVVLAKRCQEYEAKIEELEKKLTEEYIIHIGPLDEV